ncbi:hypothetical protein NDU88_007625 [Pleurodeles waltl]|uniref:C2H2-type domain-containing protein n=2 Tax=Pleurodeles waltl TaxID=8319 RepID=A0AAV7PN56_PLEWA|nr:hypothetical protein NDU88_007625 [Pleurodeles waltl]
MVRCPQCGKSFKRLKTHLPHCKMAVKEKATPNPEKVESLSATAAKPRAINCQPNGKEKKHRTNIPATTEAQSAEVAKKGKTEVSRNSTKSEYIGSNYPADIKTNNTTLMDKKNYETKITVKGSKMTLKGRISKKHVLCDPTETMHSKETDSLGSVLLNHIERPWVFCTEGTMPKMTGKVPSPATAGLCNRIDVFISNAIESHKEAEKATLISQKKQQYALLPTTVLQCPVQGKQTLLLERSGCNCPSNYSSFTTKLNSKDLNSEDRMEAEAVSMAGTKDQRVAHLTFEGEQCEKMKTLHLDKKAGLREKGKERRHIALKTSLWDNIKDSMLKGTIGSIEDTNFKQKLEPEFRTLVEDKLLNDPAEKLIYSSDSFPALQRIGHTWTSVHRSQERGTTGDCVVPLQQVPENVQQQALPISSFYPVKDHDGEVLALQKDEKTSCVGTPIKHGLTDLQENVCNNDILMDPVGLQWLPDFYSSYQELGVVPGKRHMWNDIVSSTEYVSHHEQQPAIPSERRLMNVTLGELPFWLSSRPVSAREITGVAQRAWGRYKSKYINVKRGGIGGITMLLAGYCILSYAWNYNHIKQDRWRKYH